MIDDIEDSVRAAGKIGAVQAFAMIETVMGIFLRYGTDPDGAEHMQNRAGVFGDGWKACAGALSELTTAMRQHAALSPVVSGQAEGELVHMRPDQMQREIVTVLHKYLFNENVG